MTGPDPAHRESEWSAAGYDQWPHFVRVECDYGAQGLWSESGAAFSVASLDIPKNLRDDLIAWQAIYDETDPSAPADTLGEMIYVETGLKLAMRLKVALPRCTVVAIRHRVRNDLSLGEIVPWPGEGWEEGDSGKHFREWKARFLAGEFAT